MIAHRNPTPASRAYPFSDANAPIMPHPAEAPERGEDQAVEHALAFARFSKLALNARERIAQGAAAHPIKPRACAANSASSPIEEAIAEIEPLKSASRKSPLSFLHPCESLINGLELLSDIGPGQKLRLARTFRSKALGGADVQTVIEMLAQAKLTLNDNPITALPGKTPEDAYFCLIDKLNHCLRTGRLPAKRFPELLAALGAHPYAACFGSHYADSLRELRPDVADLLSAKVPPTPEDLPPMPRRS